MSVTRFFTRLLRLEEPWKVERVSDSQRPAQVDVFLTHRKRTSFACPTCHLFAPIHDHCPSRAWRHLDHGDHLTYLHARIPRVHCLEHGVRRVAVPWALPEARYTKAFERHAIDVLLEADVLGALRLLRVSWDEAWHLMQRAVERGQKIKRRRVVRYLGIDEKAIAKRHRYVTLVSDLDRGTVEFIAADRKKTSLDAYFRSLNQRQLHGIQAVAMDMWDPFIASTKEHLEDGGSKIVFDRFHIMKHMLAAVDKTRKQEHRELQEMDDDTLKGTKYLWLFSEENVPQEWQQRLEGLRALHLRTGRAWAIKEALRDLWSYQRKGWAQRYWSWWFNWATHSRLPSVIEAAYTIQRHLPNVLTYFDHPITNATSEGINSKIQTIKKTPSASATQRTSRRPFSFIVGA